MIDIPTQQGRTIVVTGANTGIGRVTALELARAGAHVILAGRSEDRTQPVLDEIDEFGGTAEFLRLDLGHLAAVRAAADTLLQRDQPIDTLINNAGLAGHVGATKDGFEIQFGVNHLGPFLFTRHLLPLVRRGTNPRIVNVASRAHSRVNTFDWSGLQEPTRTRTGFPEYCNSKLANVLFSAELARREADHGVNVYSVHPGVVATDIWRRLPAPIAKLSKLFMISEEEGAQTTLHCAVSLEAAAQTGLYYDRCRPKTPSSAAQDPQLAAKLWSESSKWTGVEAD
jgi:NAD(P)-dependent dehydrogenase (short-subunit alcohol dehydrogenase family)